jgi:hypothetical protein
LLQGREAAAAHSRGVGGAIFARLRGRRCKRDKSQRGKSATDAVMIFWIDFIVFFLFRT